MYCILITITCLHVFFWGLTMGVVCLRFHHSPASSQLRCHSHISAGLEQNNSLHQTGFQVLPLHISSFLLWQTNQITIHSVPDIGRIRSGSFVDFVPVDFCILCLTKGQSGQSIKIAVYPACFRFTACIQSSLSLSSFLAQCQQKHFASL